MARSSADRVAVDTIDDALRDALNVADEEVARPNAAKRLELAMNTQRKLKICVELVFTKALKEPTEHSLLAQFCKMVARSTHKVEWIEDGLAKETDFKTELLLRCQYELKGVKKEEDELFRKSEAIEVAATPEKKTQLESEYQEFESRAKQRALHLFRFLGELFRMEMVPKNVMHECLVSLLQSTSNNDYLEWFCRLFTNAGPTLDHPKAETRVNPMNGYFERIEYILKKRKMSGKVALMLKEVQELGKNQWILTQKPPSWILPVRLQVALSDKNKEERETAIVLGKLRAILNKLTPQKFQKLAEQALQLEINTEERLKGCVDLIFTRVLRPEERTYARVCAHLCKVMSPLKTEWEQQGRKRQTNFRRELLTKTQIEFESDKRSDEKVKELNKAIEEAATLEEKKRLEDELKEFVSKAQERYVSIITFVGELYMLSMLSETILHECVVHLLKSSSDEKYLECFARLITITGKNLDTAKAKTRLDWYFGQIARVIKKGLVSNRIKFKLQDVQDLRKNCWVPRKHQAIVLKTIDEIRAEARIAQREEELLMLSEEQAADYQVAMAIGSLSRSAKKWGSQSLIPEESHFEAEERASRERLMIDRTRLAALLKDRKENVET